MASVAAARGCRQASGSRCPVPTGSAWPCWPLAHLCAPCAAHQVAPLPAHQLASPPAISLRLRAISSLTSPAMELQRSPSAGRARDARGATERARGAPALRSRIELRGGADLSSAGGGRRSCAGGGLPRRRRPPCAELLAEGERGEWIRVSSLPNFSAI